jgi:hypothetical protein
VFAADGEEVWYATSRFVAHFDGQHWRVWREAVATPEAASIVASKGEAWVVDAAGNLSHYAGGAWHIGKLALPGVSWDNKGAARFPELALAPDGSLWLIRSGVWRFDGAEWAPISSPGRWIEDATLLGVARGRLWLAGKEEVLSVGWDGRSWTRHTLGEMGLPPKTPIHEVAGAETAWFATNAGLVSFDGATWHLIPPPRPGMRALVSVGAGPDGTVWVAGTQTAGISALRFAFYAFAVLVVLALVALAVWMWKATKHRAKRERELIRRAIEPVPAARPRSSVAEQVLPLILAMVAVFLLQRVWPQPGWVSSVMAVLIAYELSGSVLRSLKSRDDAPSPKVRLANMHSSDILDAAAVCGDAAALDAGETAPEFARTGAAPSAGAIWARRWRLADASGLAHRPRRGPLRS